MKLLSLRFNSISDNTKIGWMIGSWMASIVIYVAFIPVIVESRIFPSVLPIITILNCIVFIPLLILRKVGKKKNEA